MSVYFRIFDCAMTELNCLGQDNIVDIPSSVGMTITSSFWDVLDRDSRLAAARDDIYRAFGKVAVHVVLPASKSEESGFKRMMTQPGIPASCREAYGAAWSIEHRLLPAMLSAITPKLYWGKPASGSTLLDVIAGVSSGLEVRG